MQATSDLPCTIPEEPWTDAELIEDDAAVADRAGIPARRRWWPWLLVAVGLYLVGGFGVKAWNLYVTIHTFEAASGVTVDHDLLNLLALGPDLALDLAMNAAAASNTPSAIADPAPDPYQNPITHDVVRTLPVPREHDVALAVVGLIAVLLGLGALSRGALRRRLWRPCAESRSAGSPVIVSATLTAMSVWEFADTLVAGITVIALAWFSNQLLAQLTTGATPSWEVADRLVDQAVGIALAASKQGW